MSHLCHAVACTTHVPAKLLFCGPHWRRTPKRLRDLIWATYRPGQEISKDPSPLYLVAQSHVVAWVAVREGRLTPEAALAKVLDEVRDGIVAGALELRDVELLARFDRSVFGPVADRMRAVAAALDEVLP